MDRFQHQHSADSKEKIMKLFKISQDENTDYDTYDSAVVAAPNGQTARNMNPRDGKEFVGWNEYYSSWCTSADKVTVEYLGEATEGIEQGVICSSFNAG